MRAASLGGTKGADDLKRSNSGLSAGFTQFIAMIGNNRTRRTKCRRSSTDLPDLRRTKDEVPVVGGEDCYTWGRTQTSVLPLLRLSATGTF
jgi:hypothetical protein